MEISLIEPKSPGLNVFSKFVMPRLGLPIIGTILKNLGHDVKIYNQDLKPLNHKKIEESDLIGISTITPTAPTAYSLADRYRRKGIKVVIGGPHVTFMADEALDHADYVVRGEGEETIVELVKAMETGGDESGIAGLSYLDNGRKKHNPGRPLLDDLDKLPIPDFTLIEGHEKLAYTPIATSRGCPFNCKFCSVTPMFGRGYRQRSVDLIIEELNNFPRSKVFFYDDNFVVNKNYTKELLEKLTRRKHKMAWGAQARVDVYKDKEILKLMQASNCDTLYIGFESLNPETLDSFNKKQSVSQMRECIRVLHKNNIRVHGMFVFGADTDDKNVFRNTLEFVQKEKIDTVQFMILTPLPGTETYRELSEQNRLLHRNWGLYDAHHVVFRPVKMSCFDLQVETIQAMHKFYSILSAVRKMLLGKYYQAGRKIMGNYIITQWEKMNRDFIRNLQTFTLPNKQKTSAV